MNRNRTRSGVRLLPLVLVALLVVGCGESLPESRSRMNDEVTALESSLAEAITTSYQASAGRIEAVLRPESISEVRAAASRLAETAMVVDQPAQTLAQELLTTTEHALVLVAEYEFEEAERLRTDDFAATAAQLADLPLDPEAQPATPSSSGPGRIALLAAGAFALAGLAVVSRHRARPRTEGQPAQPRRDDRTQPSPSQMDRAWSEIPPMFNPARPTEPADVEESEGHRSPTARMVEVDLRELLRSALHQIRDYDIETSITCPSVEISVDPVKFRRAVLSALANAHLGGAQRVGFLVELIDDTVLLTIGRDIPPKDSDAEGFAERFVSQMSGALDTEELEWSLISDDELSLTTVVIQSKVNAGEVSGTVV